MTLPKIFTLLFTATIFFFSTTPLSADDFEDTLLGLNLGYRNDSLQISTDAKLPSINVVRKQSWQDISLFTYGISGSTYAQYNIFLRGKLEYGKMLGSGASVQSPILDLLEANHKRVTRGNTYEGLLLVGFPIWRNCCDNFHIIPLVGYDYDRLKYKGRDHLRRLTDLTECYKARIHNIVTIQGCVAGIDAVYTCCLWRFIGSYQFRWGRIRSRCEYHTIGLFEYIISDHAQGYGNTFALGASYIFSTEWESCFTLQYRDWHSYKGRNKTHYQFSTTTHKAHSGIKNICWQSWDLTWHLVLRF